METTRDKDRVEDLNSYKIMDTAPEMAFDQIVYLASTIAQTPIAIVSFIDEQRQWIKSAIGIDLAEISRALALCIHEKDGPELLEIEDLLKHQDCKNEEPLEELGIRFYAGIPLLSSNGHMIGTLCVMDYVPRKLTDRQRNTLKILASQVMDEVEMRRLYRERLQDFNGLVEYKNTTEVKQRKLMHDARLDAMAEMAVGVSFQINDPLYLIKGCVRTLQELVEESEFNRPVLKSELNVIDANVKRMTEFMKSLKLFSYDGDEWRKPVDLNRLIEDVILIMGQRISRAKVKVSFFKMEEVYVVGNPRQISEAMRCLLSNALDAMASTPNGEVHVELNKEGNYAVIRVKDEGNGVPEDIKDFIFHPLFSTKGEGKKADVCLCLAKSYIDSHMGEMKLEQARKPTTFTIKLPLPILS